jgi:membrane-associated protease RseP (regulator of RpoE activity)
MDAPPPHSLRPTFRTYEVRNDGDRVEYVGDPLAPRDEVVEAVRPTFNEAGYDVSLSYRDGQFVLVAEPEGGVPWRNVALFALTVLTTLYAGAGWYYVRDPLSPAILQALPFTLAVLGVLGTHELGHYVASRYHGVEASLPYFIPMIPPIGTMGAVIRMRGRMPDRKALFDIGAAGPLAGLVATVAVTVVGLSLPPVTVPEWVFSGSTLRIEFGYPLLLRGIAAVLGEPLSYPGRRTVLNPVVIGGWVGMFITFLNMIPVGQLDGGHITRALLGPRQETVAALVPGALFALAAGLFLRGSDGASIWLFWGVLAAVFAYVGPAEPDDDEAGLGWRRTVVAVVTLVAAALCFVPVPIRVG